MYIYVVSICGKPSPVKIGKSGNPRRRLHVLQNGNPERLILEWATKVDFAEHVEPATHKVLDKSRVGGEWFSVTTVEAIAAIESCIQEIGDRPPVIAKPVDRSQTMRVKLLNDFEENVRELSNEKDERRRARLFTRARMRVAIHLVRHEGYSPEDAARFVKSSRPQIKRWLSESGPLPWSFRPNPRLPLDYARGILLIDGEKQ